LGYAIRLWFVAAANEKGAAPQAEAPALGDIQMAAILNGSMSTIGSM